MAVRILAAAVLVLAGLLGAAAPARSQAQTPKEGGKEDAQSKRVIYFVKYGTAEDLAGVLAKFFKGEAGVQFAADAANNALLISAGPAVLGEIMKTLAQLDQRPRQVNMEVIVLDLKLTKGADGKPAPS